MAAGEGEAVSFKGVAGTVPTVFQQTASPWSYFLKNWP